MKNQRTTWVLLGVAGLFLSHPPMAPAGAPAPLSGSSWSAYAAEFGGPTPPGAGGGGWTRRPGLTAGIEVPSGAILLGSIAALMAVDETVRPVIQRNRTGTTDEIANVLNSMGGPEVYLPVGAGLLATGLLSGDSRIRGAGIRVSSSLILAGVLVRCGKFFAGRERPAGEHGSHAFDSFSRQTAFPSGHTTMAFALATSLSREIDRPWASKILFGLAAGTGLARLNRDKHWLSDVAAGAALGYYSSRLVGSWPVLGGGTPTLSRVDHRLAVGWAHGF